jgi:hypothetical protein
MPDEKLCECGCGSPVTQHRYQPRRFLLGHSRRGKSKYANLPIDVSECDRDLLEQYWTRYKPGKSRTLYAVRNTRLGRFDLHRIVAERIIGRALAKNEVPDHIDGNGLNNRRGNLRIVSSRNNANH